MSFIGRTGLEPDDSMAQRDRRADPDAETRSARVSWSEVAVAWVMTAASLVAFVTLCLVLR